MFWVILGLICLVLFIVGIIDVVKYDFDSSWFLPTVFSFIFLICIVILVPLFKVQDQKNTEIFKQQKEYIETYVSENEIENASLTTKKIELNSWLYNAKYSKKNYSIFVFYPDEILDLEPIK